MSAEPFKTRDEAEAWWSSAAGKAAFKDAQGVLFIQRLREVARGCGYALAVHGSEARDLDLIAAPWTDQAVSAAELVERIRETTPLKPRKVNVYEGADHEPQFIPNPEHRPHGRIAWSFAGCPPKWAYVDLSIMAREPVPCEDGDAK